MKENTLSMIVDRQDTLRKEVTKIFHDGNHSITSLSAEMGLTHQTLSTFFQGRNLTRKTELRIRDWLTLNEVGK